MQEHQLVEVGEETEVSVRPSGPKLTPAKIKAIAYDLKMAEQLVFETLEDGIDYGQIPGVPGKGLWDPGAAKIMNAFETYPKHTVLYHEENASVITWALEALIIHRPSQRIVGAGVGACSTREPKYKYRWVSKEEAERLGYTEVEINQMKTKKRKFYQEGKPVADVLEYRVENPEYGEQVNTIFQMAAKRSETDAAKTLPGVSSALRKLLEGKPVKRQGKAGQMDDDSPRWTTFWNAAKDLLGDDYEVKTREMLGVKSMKDWLSSGKSLDDAIRIISTKLAGKAQKGQAEWDKITKEDVDTYPKLEKVFERLTGIEGPAVMYKELGVGSQNDMAIPPWDAWLNIKSFKQPKEE